MSCQHVTTALLVGLGILGGAALSLATETARESPAAQGDPASKPADAILIPAYAYDRGNPKTYRHGETYADAQPMVTWGGQYPVVVEYDIDFPVTAEYAIQILYAAAEPRPAELLLDGKAQGTCCRTATGSWNTSSARWEETCRLTIAKGLHTVKLSRNAPFPHLVALRFDSPEPFPPDWRLHRPGARRLVDGPVGGDVRVAPLRLAIADLQRTFGARYPRAPEFLERLEAIEEQLDAAALRSTDKFQELSGGPPPQTW